MIAIPLIAAGLIAALAAGTADPSGPPSGTYLYELAAHGKPFGRSALAVTHEPATIAIHEHAEYGPATVEIDARFAADTRTLERYGASYRTAERSSTRSVAIVANTALVSGDDGTTTIAAAAGAPHFAVLDQAFLSGFFMLPAEHLATRDAKLTGITPLGGHAFALDIGPDDTALARPASVPAGDRALRLVAPVEVVEWFDPATLIVDRIDVPSQGLLVRRISQAITAR